MHVRRKQPSEPPKREVLAGLIEHVRFHSAENGFCVLRVKARGHRDQTTVTGHAATATAGEWITATGEWSNHPKHGPQFKAHFIRSWPPSASEDIEKYLRSGAIRGIGRIYAAKLVLAFKDKVLDVIENEPERLQQAMPPRADAGVWPCQRVGCPIKSG